MASFTCQLSVSTPPLQAVRNSHHVPFSRFQMLYRPSPSLMPNLKDVSKLLIKQANGTIPYRASTVMLAYNSTKVTKVPKTLDEVLAWIKANPGKFTYNVPSGGGSGYAFAQTVVDKYLSAEELDVLQTQPNKDLQSDQLKLSHPLLSNTSCCALHHEKSRCKKELQNSLRK